MIPSQIHKKNPISLGLNKKDDNKCRTILNITLYQKAWANDVTQFKVSNVALIAS